MTTRHPIDRDEVMAYLDGELPADRAGVVQAHLETCDGCRALADDLRTVSAKLQAWQVGDAPEHLTQQMERAIHADADGAAGTKRLWLRWPVLATLPRWSLAAASLAGAALVLAVVVPRHTTAPDAVAQMASRQANEQPAAIEPGPGDLSAAPTETLEKPDQLRDEEAGPGRTVGGVVGSFDRPGSEVTARAEPPGPPAQALAAPARVTGLERRAADTAPPPVPATPPVGQVAGQVRDLAMPARPVAELGKVAGQGAGAGDAGVQLEAAVAAAAARPIDLVIPEAGLDETRRSIEELVRSLDGWLADAPMSGAGDEQSWHVTLLVPAERVEQLLEGLRRLGTIEEGSPADQATADRLADAASRREQAVEAERRELAAVALRVRIVRDLGRHARDGQPTPM